MKMKSSLILWILVLSSACVFPGRKTLEIDDSKPLTGVAIYRAKYTDSEQKRGFRVLFWSDLDTRVHAEIVSPVGQTLMVLDGSDQQFAVWDPRKKVGYQGSDPDRVFDLWIGIPWKPSEWIRVLRGEQDVPSGWTVERAGAIGGYPRNLILADDSLNFSLDLKRLKPDPQNSQLGNGKLPNGYTFRELELWFEPDPID